MNGHGGHVWYAQFLIIACSAGLSHELENGDLTENRLRKRSASYNRDCLTVMQGITKKTSLDPVVSQCNAYSAFQNSSEGELR